MCQFDMRTCVHEIASDFGRALVLNIPRRFVVIVWTRVIMQNMVRVNVVSRDVLDEEVRLLERFAALVRAVHNA